METLIQQGTQYEKYVLDILKDKYKSIWLWNNIPKEILLELNFIKDIQNTCDDIGCDILAKNNDNTYDYIQCKNYSTLGIDNVITISDLSGFYNFVAENDIRNPIVYYSGVLSSQIQCRKKRIKYINLPFIKISNEDIKPRDYQLEAFNTLKDVNRGILEMPCGTGKTLITYLISLNYDNVILLSPLIATTDQLITHYKKYYSQEKEPITFNTVHCHGIRNPDVIDFGNKNVLGATFDSCDVVNKIIPKLTGSIFIVIDECHNLSNTMLTDSNNEVNKLLMGNYKVLFVSATPKNYGSEFSNIFGSIRYKLDWQDAIKNKYICDYEFYYPNANKIIEYIDEIKFNKSVIEKTKLIYKAFFLLESIKNMNIKKCIVYLKTVEELEQFKKILGLVNIYHDLKLSIYSIDYKTGKNARNSAITKFRNNKVKISILLNVHVLDEGIDIPECDSVFLTNPNNNPVNIIQRISRANRKCSDNHNKIAKILIWGKDRIKIDNILSCIGKIIKVNIGKNISKFINLDITDNNFNKLNENEDINNIQINKIKIFNKIKSLFNTSNYLFDRNNTVWLSYNNILKSLGYTDIKKLKKRLDIDKEYFSSYEIIYPQSKLNKIKIDYQKPNEKFINESGLYLLLSQSSKKVAKELSAKLFTEVLPELRKKGKFVLNTTEKRNMNKLTSKLKNYQNELKRTKKQSYPDKTGHGFIYILKVPTSIDGTEKKCYKIGYTTDLEKRLATYKTGNPDVELVHNENVACDSKQLENCVLNLNILNKLTAKNEIICNKSLREIKKEIKDCKKLIARHSTSS